MTCWLYLRAAIVAEVFSTLFLKESHGFSKLMPMAIRIIGYGIVIVGFSFAVKAIDLGIAYAVLGEIGTATFVTIGWLVFGQQRDLWPGAGRTPTGCGPLRRSHIVFCTPQVQTSPRTLQSEIDQTITRNHLRIEQTPSAEANPPIATEKRTQTRSRANRRRFGKKNSSSCCEANENDSVSNSTQTISPTTKASWPFKEGLTLTGDDSPRHSHR
jgi:small multidrug resistance pump